MSSVLKIRIKINNEEFTMSKKNSNRKSDKRKVKKATVLDAGKKENAKSMITVAAIAAVVAGLLFFFYRDNNSASDQKYHPKNVTFSLFWGDIAFNSPREDDQADLIVILDCAQSKKGADLHNGFALELPDSAEFDG